MDVCHAPAAPGRGPSLLRTRVKELEEQECDSDASGDGIQQSFRLLSQRHCSAVFCSWTAAVSRRVRGCVRAAQVQKHVSQQLSKFLVSGPVLMETPLGARILHFATFAVPSNKDRHRREELEEYGASGSEGRAVLRLQGLSPGLHSTVCAPKSSEVHTRMSLHIPQIL